VARSRHHAIAPRISNPRRIAESRKQAPAPKNGGNRRQPASVSLTRASVSPLTMVATKTLHEPANTADGPSSDLEAHVQSRCGPIPAQADRASRNPGNGREVIGRRRRPGTHRAPFAIAKQAVDVCMSAQQT